MVNVSYGLNMVRLPAEIDPDKAYLQYVKKKEEDVNAGSSHSYDSGPLDPLKEDRKQRLAAALIAENPKLEKFERNYAKVAAHHSIDESEARRRFRDIELNDDQNSIQINLFDDEAALALSFTGKGADCIAAARVVWGCLQVLASQGDFTIYDPQFARTLNVNTDFDIFCQGYCGAAQETE